MRSPHHAPVALALAATLSYAYAAGDPARWSTYPASLKELLRAYPSRDANRSALELERLASKLGIDLAPRHLEDRAHPGEESAARFREIREPLGDYVNEQLTRPDGGVEPAPVALSEFLSASQETLEAIRHRLAHGDSPLWERHLENLDANVLPNMLGQINLQKTLVADALDRTAHGDEPGALADLDASWTLNTALRDDPILITQIIAIAEVRMQAGALRHIPTSPALWVDRLHEHDFRDSMLAAFQFQGWMWTQVQVPADYREDEGPIGKLVGRFATEPYIRICMRNAAEIRRTQLARLADRPTLCDLDPDATMTELRDEVPWWNRLGVLLLQTMPKEMVRIPRLELDIELTSRILALHAARLRSGAWPPLANEGNASEACADARWIYEAAPGGERSIRLEPDHRWKDQVGLILPTSFVSIDRTRRN